MSLNPFASAGHSPTGDRLALLYHLSQTFNSSLDLDEVLNRVMDEVIIATHAERGFVMLKGDSGELAVCVARGIDQVELEDSMFQVSLSVVEGVARDGQPVLTGDAQIDPRFHMRQSVRLLGLRSILCVPLTTRSQVMGVVYVDNRIQAGIFTPADLDLLSAIAASAAIAIENARLYQVAVEKGRLEKELETARQVQAGLLPTHTPQFEGWEFVARWLPARQVAGDYYDFIPTQDGCLGVVVADVSDKGMPAALFQTLTRSVMRASLDGVHSAVEGMQRANRLISADSPGSMFVTLFYACINPADGHLTYINAGHNPPLRYQRGKRPGQGALIPLTRTGMALGVDAEAAYSACQLSLAPGDFILLYTDGVTDALSPAGDDFGLRRLEDIVLAQRDAGAAQLAAALEAALSAHVADAALFDDVTFMVIRRTL